MLTDAEDGTGFGINNVVERTNFQISMITQEIIEDNFVEENLVAEADDFIRRG